MGGGGGDNWAHTERSVQSTSQQRIYIRKDGRSGVACYEQYRLTSESARGILHYNYTYSQSVIYTETHLHLADTFRIYVPRHVP